MAARETQVLHIALIIFVGLTVVLIVVSYIFFRNNQESQERVKAAQAESTKANIALRKSTEETDAVKSLLGAGNADAVKTVQDNFAADKEKFAPKFTEKANYRSLIEYLFNQNVAANKQQGDVAVQVKTLKDQIEKLEQERTAEVKKYSDAQKKSDAELASEVAKFAKDRKRLEQQAAELAAQITDKGKLVDEANNKVTATQTAVTAEIKKLKTQVKGLTEKEKEETLSNELPDGEITWIDQRLRVVWINRGSDDSLPKQISFSVVGKEETNMQTAKKKAKLEVTRILEPHLAEARIVADKYENPIMPGDLIFSPLWQPGEGGHFALAGMMDIDDDGESDREAIKELIRLNNGVVDAEATDNGEKKGAITAKTRYVVRGEPPTDKTAEKVHKAYGAILTEAQEYGIRTMSLRDLLDQMGYKSEVRSVLLGKAGEELAAKKNVKKQTIAKQEAKNLSVPEKPKVDEFKPRLPIVKRGATF